MIKTATFRWGCTDPEVLRPLVESGVCIGFIVYEEFNDSVMDAIESLRIRNIQVSLLFFFFPIVY